MCTSAGCPGLSWTRRLQLFLLKAVAITGYHWGKFTTPQEDTAYQIRPARGRRGEGKVWPELMSVGRGACQHARMVQCQVPLVHARPCDAEWLYACLQLTERGRRLLACACMHLLLLLLLLLLLACGCAPHASPLAACMHDTCLLLVYLPCWVHKQQLVLRL